MFTDKLWNGLQEAMQHYDNVWFILALTVFLGIATYTDLRETKIPNKLNVAFVVVRLCLIPVMGFSWLDIAGSLILFVSLLIPAMVKMQKMGGDIKCGAVLGLYLGAYGALPFMLLACVYFVGYHFITLSPTKKLIPFAPFFLGAHLSLLILSFVL